MKLLKLLSLSILLHACTTEPSINYGKSGDDSSHLREPQQHNIRTDNSLNFSEFIITKSAVGNIQIGMTIQEIDSIISGLVKEEIEAWELGYDGGGIAYKYLLSDIPFIGIIPSRGTDSIIGLIALHPELKTRTGASPQMSAGELYSIYPDSLFYKSLMTSHEYLYDSTNNWIFMFKTNPSNQIAEYPEIEVGAIPENLEPKMDWIMIR